MIATRSHSFSEQKYEPVKIWKGSKPTTKFCAGHTIRTWARDTHTSYRILRFGYTTGSPSSKYDSKYKDLYREKTYRFCNLRNERISIKISLPVHFCENFAKILPKWSLPCEICSLLRKFGENDPSPAKSVWKNGEICSFFCENSAKSSLPCHICPFLRELCEICPFLRNFCEIFPSLRKFCENDLSSAKSLWKNGETFPVKKSAKMIPSFLLSGHPSSSF